MNLPAVRNIGGITLPTSTGVALGRSAVTQAAVDSGGDMPTRVSVLGPINKFEIGGGGDAEGERFDELTDVVISAVIIQRQMFPQPYKPGENNEPICRSANALVGFPDTEKFDYETYAPQSDPGAVAVECSKCTAKDWNGSEKPPCADKFRLVFNAAQSEDVLSMTVGGASYVNIRDYLQSFGDDEPYWSTEAKFTLEHIQNAGSFYSKIHFAKTGEVPESEWGDYAQQAEKWLPFYADWIPRELKDQMSANAEVVDAKVISEG